MDQSFIPKIVFHIITYRLVGDVLGCKLSVTCSKSQAGSLYSSKLTHTRIYIRVYIYRIYRVLEGLHRILESLVLSRAGGQADQPIESLQQDAVFLYALLQGFDFRMSSRLCCRRRI